MRSVVLALLLLAGHAHAINKCTGPDGKVVFQDAPCTGKGEVLRVVPASGGAPVAPAVTGASEADRINAATAQSQKDRRKRELRTMYMPGSERALLDHKAACAAEQQRLEADQYRYKQNIYGKTHAAQIASEMSAAATRCMSRERELVEARDALRNECKELGC